MSSWPILLGIAILFFALWKYPWPGFEKKKKYILLSLLGLRMFVGLGTVALYTYYYTDNSKADVHRYYNDAVNMAEVHANARDEFWANWFGLANDFEYEGRHFDCMLNWVHPYGNRMYNDNRAVIRTHAILRLLGGNSLWAHSLVFSVFGFVGSYLICRVIACRWKLPSTGLLVVLHAIPAVLIWSSAPLKEALVLFQMGLALGSWFLLKNRIWRFLGAAFAIALLYFTKSYMAFLLTGFLGVYGLSTFWESLKKRRSNSKLFAFFIPEIAFPLLGIAFYVGFSSLTGWNPLLQMLSTKLQHFLNLAASENAGSQIYLPAFDPNWLSFLRTLKWGLINAVFRPLPGDFQGIFTWIMLPESFAMLLIGLGIWSSMRNGMRAWLWSSFWYGLALVVLMGVTTPVLGSLFRYKMPIWPIFLPYLWIGTEHVLKTVRTFFKKPTPL